MRGSILTAVGVLAFVFSAGGCENSDPLAPATGAAKSNAADENASALTESDVQQADPNSNSNPKATADKKKSAVASTDGAGKSESIEDFKPPYPQRVDFFSPPERVQRVASKTTEKDETIELRGFANVGEPKVVLNVDGVITPIAQGGQKFGVQVITIDPPKVVLQRGRERWTATLDN